MNGNGQNSKIIRKYVVKGIFHQMYQEHYSREENYSRRKVFKGRKYQLHIRRFQPRKLFKGRKYSRVEIQYTICIGDNFMSIITIQLDFNKKDTLND